MAFYPQVYTISYMGGREDPPSCVTGRHVAEIAPSSSYHWRVLSGAQIWSCYFSAQQFIMAPCDLPGTLKS